MYLTSLMHKAATRILVCVLSFVFAFSSVLMEETAAHPRARIASAAVSCLAPSVKAKENIQTVVNWKDPKNIMLLSVLFKKRMFDQNKYPFAVTLLFFKIAFANGLAVLNSCAGQSLVKTVSSVAKVNPAFVNAALAFLMFVQDDEENTESKDTARFSEPYIKEWLRDSGYADGNKNISAASIAKWLSFITGGLTREKVKVYEYNLARSRESEQFAMLTSRPMHGVYLYGDGTHWTVENSELKGNKRYLLADPKYLESYYGIKLQFPLSEKDALKVFGAGLDRSIQNQKEKNAIILFWVGVLSVGGILAAVYGPSVIDSLLQNFQQANPELYNFLAPLFSKPEATEILEQTGPGFGIGFFIVGVKNIIEKALRPFNIKPETAYERRRNNTGVLLGRKVLAKDTKKHEQVIAQARKHDIVLPATGVRKDLWEEHGQVSITRNGAAVPDQLMLPAYEPVFDEKTGEFIYWKQSSSFVANIFYDENTAVVQSKPARISKSDNSLNQMAIISARQKGIILPEQGIDSETWFLSGKRWICQNGAKHLGAETLAAYVPVFDEVNREFRYWKYAEQVPNPFFVGFFAADSKEVESKSVRARIANAVKKAIPKENGTTINGEDAWKLRQADAYQRSVVMVSA